MLDWIDGECMKPEDDDSDRSQVGPSVDGLSLLCDHIHIEDRSHLKRKKELPCGAASAPGGVSG